MAQFARPDSDVTINGSWVNEAGGTTNLYLSLDEVVASDADYVQSANNPDSTALYECGLSNITDPAVSTGHVIRYRMGKDATSGRTINVDVVLFQGTTEIARWTHSNIDAVTNYSQTLTGPQADAITDYTNLRFRFNPTTSGGGAARAARIAWIELETPDAAPQGFTRTATDNVATTDQVGSNGSVYRRPLDDASPLGPADTVERFFSLTRTSTDTTSVTDSIVRSLSLARTANDDASVDYAGKVRSFNAVGHWRLGESEPIARDTFGRSVTDGWGSADTGGAWVLNGSAADFDVNGTRGTIAVAAGVSSRAHLPVSQRDVRVRTSFVASVMPGVGYFSVGLGVRGDSTFAERYVARLLSTWDGTPELSIQRSSPFLSLATQADYMSWAAGQKVWLEMEAVGASPTTIRARAWLDGNAPGPWLEATDSQAALQDAGTVGVHTGPSGDLSPSLTVSVDDFTAHRVGEVSIARDAFARTVASGWGSADVGGAWALTGTASDFSVDGAAGVVTPSGVSRRMALDTISALNTDVALRFKYASQTQLSTSCAFASRVTSHMITQSYRGDVEINSADQAVIRLFRNVGGVSTSLATKNMGAALADTWYRVRAQISGTNPTTLRMKFWPDGSSEPSAWDLEATDSQAELQSAGFFQIGNLNGNRGAWTFDDLSVQPVALDAIANAAGSYLGDVSLGITGLLTGDADTAMQVGGGSRLSVPVHSLSAPYTVQFWTKRAGTHTGGDFARLFSAGADQLEIALASDGTVKFLSGGVWTDVTTLAAGEVALITYVYDGTTVTFYKNATQVYSAANGRDLDQNNKTLGAVADGTESTNSTYDEFAIYSVALTAQQVADLYASGAGASVTDQIGSNRSVYRLLDDTAPLGSADTVTRSQGVTRTAADDVAVAFAAKVRARNPIAYWRLGDPVARDAFTRTVTDGWGSADRGGAWETSGGAAADYAVGGSTATINSPSGNTHRRATLSDTALVDTHGYFRFRLDKVPVGGDAVVYGLSRWIDSSNYWRADCRVTPAGEVRVVGTHVVNGATTSFGSSTVALTGYTAGEWIAFRWRVEGVSPGSTVLRLKAWRTANAEPSAWTASPSGVVTGLDAPGRAGTGTIVLATNLPLLTEFDDFDASAGNPRDSSGNAHHVTSVTGSPTYGETGALTGDADSAIALDGSTEYFSVSDRAAFDLGNGPFTIMAWTKRASLNANHGILSKQHGAYYLRWNTDNRVQLVRSNQADIATSTVAHADTDWHFVVCTYAGSNGAVKFYVDGVDESPGSNLATPSFVDNNSALNIGIDDTAILNEWFNGTLDEVALFGTVLTAQQVADLYASAGGGFAAKILSFGPTAYWRLGESSGSVADDLVGTRDGTYVNSPTLGVAGLLTGDPDKAVSLNGTGHHITHPAITCAGAFTWAGWTNSPMTVTDMLAGLGGSGKFGVANGLMFVRVVDGGASDNTVARPTQNATHFFVLTRDASNVVRLYIDGTAYTLFGGAAQAGNCVPQTIGRSTDGTGQYWEGVVDEVAVWNGTALTQQQVSDLYASGTTAITAPDSVTRNAIAGRSATDTTSVTDEVGSNGSVYRRPLDDASVGSDAISHNVGVGASYVELYEAALVVPGVAGGAQALTRTAEDTTAVTDSVTRTSALARVVADTTTVTDDVDGQAAQTRTATETTTTTDQVARSGEFTRTATDTTAVTDVLNQGQVRRADDTVTTTDSVARSGTFTRGIVDTTSTSDAVERVVGVARAATDTTTTTDSVAQQGTFTRTATDTTTTADSLDRQVAAQTAVTDSTTVTDAVMRNGTFTRTATDAVTTTDAVTPTVGARREATDTTSVTDTVAGTLTSYRTADDTVTTTDAVDRSASLAREATDTTSVTDSVAVAGVAFSRTATDTTAVTDSVSHSLTAERTADDTVTTTDAVDRQVGGAQALADTTTVNDSVARIGTFTRTAADAVSTSDSVEYSAPKVRTATDTTVVTDSVDAASTHQRSAEDTTAVDESVTRTLGVYRTPTDSQSTTDSVEHTAAKVRDVTDTTTVTDDVTRAGTFTRQSTDTVPIGSDSIDTGDAAKTRQATDTVVIGADTVDRLAGLHVVADDVTTVSDEAASAVAANRSAEDATTVTDAVAGRIDHFRAASDTVATTDEISRTSDVHLSAVDSTTVDDFVDRLLLLTRQAADATTTTDSVSATTEGVSALSDTVVTTDAVTRALSASRTAGDAQTTTDAISANRALQRTAEDATSVSDAVSVETVRLRTATDTTTVTDAAAAAKALVRAATDTTSTTDQIDTSREFTRTASDTTAVTDSVEPTLGDLSAVEDTTTVTDTVVTRRDFYRVVADTVLTTDSVARQAARSLSVEDWLDTTDSLFWFSSVFVPTVKADVQSTHVGRNNATVRDATGIIVRVSENTGNGTTRARSATGVVVRVRVGSTSRRVTVGDG